MNTIPVKTVGKSWICSSALFLFLSFISISATAQTEQNKDSSLTNEKFLKNEIGISLNPVLVVMLGANINETRWALTYRRHLNKKWSVRFIGGIHFSRNFNSLFGNYSYQQYDITDSTGYAISKNRRDYYGYSVQTGLQYNWGKKKLKWFTGIDLFYADFKKIYYTDSIYGKTYPEYPNIINPESITQIKKENYTAKHYGIFPFIGIRAMFNKHWGFSTHFGYRITYAFESDVTYEYGVQTFGHRYTSFNLYADAIFQDVSIVFRF